MRISKNLNAKEKSMSMRTKSDLEEMFMKRKLDLNEKMFNRPLTIVYDMTRRCPWDCKICCMGAERGKNVLRDELSLDEKLGLMDDIEEVNKYRDVSIDFSGGELFMDMNNIKVIEKIAELIGKDKVGISSSGYKIDDKVAERLSHCISDCEMTMDTLPGHHYALRKDGYPKTAANAIPYLQKYGISVGIQTVLANSNCNEQNLTDLYRYLCNMCVDKWSFIKFYPSGKGAAYPNEVLNEEKEAWVIDFITNLSNNNTDPKKPEVDFHYTMKGHKKSSNECRCVRKSIGILPDGSVTSCFWAVDSLTHVTEDKYRLGSVRESSLLDILNGNKAAYWNNSRHECELCAA